MSAHPLRIGALCASLALAACSSAGDPPAAPLLEPCFSAAGARTSLTLTKGSFALHCERDIPGAFDQQHQPAHESTDVTVANVGAPGTYTNAIFARTANALDQPEYGADACTLVFASQAWPPAAGARVTGKFSCSTVSRTFEGPDKTFRASETYDVTAP